MSAQGGKRVSLVILGEAASKANSRIPVPAKSREGKPFIRFIKSEKAQEFVRQAEKQLPTLSPLLTGPLVLYCRVFYASERPDLDTSLVEDVLQGRVIVNDRQLREKHLYHAIDRANPRVEIVLEPMQPCLL